MRNRPAEIPPTARACLSELAESGPRLHLATRDDVYFCHLGSQIVFLDIARDRYFGTPPDTARAILHAMKQPYDLGADEPLFAPLLADGLLVATDNEGRHLEPTSHSPAASEWTDWPRPSWAFVARTLAAQLSMMAHLRRRPLAKIIRQRRLHLHTRRLRRSPAEIISAYRATDLILSPNQRCLTKSLTLFDSLRSAGCRPQLVIGVRDMPFAAHAWVELGDAVVNDRADHVALFQPILVL